MNEITTTVFVLYAPGYGFLYGNRLEASKDFSNARFFSKEHFARNSLKMQTQSHPSKLKQITVEGILSEIKILPVTVSVDAKLVFMSELGGTA